MYKKILVPLDGSKVGESVLPYVKCLAQALNTPVHLLHVREQQRVNSTADGLQGSDYLNQIASSFLASLQVQCLVEIGKPAEVIVKTAAEDADSLIVMAARIRSAIRRRLSGSVAHTVFDGVENPFFLVQVTDRARPVDSVELKTIVVLLDGSAVGEKILSYVLEIAKGLKSEVILVRTYSLPRGCRAFAKRFYVPYTDQVAESVKKEARAYLEAKVQELKAEPIGSVSYRLLEEYDLTEMNDLAPKTPYDMLAMYAPKKFGVGRLFIGNVTERIMRRWNNPVLVVQT